MNLRMRNFDRILKICADESAKATRKFDDTLALIEEMVVVTTATAGDNSEKVEEAKKLMAAFEIEKKNLEEQKEM